MNVLVNFNNSLVDYNIARNVEIGVILDSPDDVIPLKDSTQADRMTGKCKH